MEEVNSLLVTLSTHSVFVSRPTMLALMFILALLIAFVAADSADQR